MLDAVQIKAVVEALLFASDKPLSLKQMAARIRHVMTRDLQKNEAGESSTEVPAEGAVASAEGDALAELMAKGRELESVVDFEQIRAAVIAIENDLSQKDRGLELVQVARGYQLRTKPELISWLRDEKKAVPNRLSPSSLETLAIIAYEQPLARSRLEDIRGVDCGGVLKTLLDRDLIRIVGRSDDAGRPLVYGTTAKFLEIFSLYSLKDLPEPGEFAELAAAAPTDEFDISPETPDPETTYFEASDFSEDDNDPLTEAEKILLGELDASLKDLKSVEAALTPLSQNPDSEAKKET